jgi:glutamate-5-semialdehyde dehydrogenase
MNDFQSLTLKDLITQARQASAHLAQTPVQVRNLALKDLLNTLQTQQDTILEANTLDLEIVRDLAVADLGLQWLKLTPERLSSVRQFIEQLIGLPDPLQFRSGSVANALYGLGGSRIIPRGVICGLYEFLPEFPALLASLCLKTGNSLLIRGNLETSYTHQFWVDTLGKVLTKGALDPRCFYSVPSDRTVTVKDLVAHDLPIDLIVPYGRHSFVQEIIRNRMGSVLTPVMGNCYLFWSASGSSDLVRTIIVDSHSGLPDAVNAIEKVLITQNTNFSLLNVVFSFLREKGFALRGDEVLAAEFPDLTIADAQEWSQPYLNKTVAFKVVSTLSEGIQWINDHSSGHADAIVTEAYRDSQQFTLGVNSATLFINASPKFSRLTSGPCGTVALGMVGRHSAEQGPIGIETFLKRSQIIQGIGSSGSS